MFNRKLQIQVHNIIAKKNGHYLLLYTLVRKAKVLLVKINVCA